MVTYSHGQPTFIIKFVQVSAEVPVTKRRNPEKYDTPDVFEGHSRAGPPPARVFAEILVPAYKEELATDLIVKAKQAEYLIRALPEPGHGEEQARRLHALEDEMKGANAEHIQAVGRARDSHRQITDVLWTMLTDTDVFKDMPG